MIGEGENIAFRRAPDRTTGFSELVVEPRGAPNLSSPLHSAPCLVCFSGLPGVGKTTLARAVASSTGAMFLRIDDIEQAIKSSLGGVEVGAAGYASA